MINVDSLSWNKKLQVLRVIKGWSQEVAAAECGTNKKVFWLWESGKSYPRTNSRRAIASSFGVTESDIFGARNETKYAVGGMSKNG